MFATYINTTTSGTTPATVIDPQAGGDDIRVIKKIIIGNPVTAGNITLFNENNALSNNTTQIIYKQTFPSFSATNTNGVSPVVIDFTTNSNSQAGLAGSDGLQVRGGGSMAIDNTMQVTVLWDFSET